MWEVNGVNGVDSSSRWRRNPGTIADRRHHSCRSHLLPAVPSRRFAGTDASFPPGSG